MDYRSRVPANLSEDSNRLGQKVGTMRTLAIWAINFAVLYIIGLVGMTVFG